MSFQLSSLEGGVRRRGQRRVSVTTGVMPSDSELIPAVYSAASSGPHPEASDLQTDGARRRWPLGVFPFFIPHLKPELLFEVVFFLSAHASRHAETCVDCVAYIHLIPIPM